MVGSSWCVIAVGLVAAAAIPLPQSPTIASTAEADDGRQWLESPAPLTASSPAILRGAEAVALNKANAKAGPRFFDQLHEDDAFPRVTNY